MAISKLINLDQTVTVDLKFKGEPIGVSFEVRSIENPDAQMIVRKRRSKAMTKMAMSGKKDVAIEDEAMADLVSDMIDPSADVLATCVVSWDWGNEEFEEGEGAPEFSHENVVRVLSHPASFWIRPQIQQAAQNIEGFTKA
jgi:hypothetical protein